MQRSQIHRSKVMFRKNPGSSETPPAQNQQDAQAPVQDQTYTQDNAHVQDPNTQSVY